MQTTSEFAVVRRTSRLRGVGVAGTLGGALLIVTALGCGQANPKGSGATAVPAGAVPGGDRRIDQAQEEILAGLAEFERLIPTVQDEASAQAALPKIEAIAARIYAARKTRSDLIAQRAFSFDQKQFSQNCTREVEMSGKVGKDMARLYSFPGGRQVVSLWNAKSSPPAAPDFLEGKAEEPSPSGLEVTIWDAKATSGWDFQRASGWDPTLTSGTVYTLRYRVEKKPALPNAQLYWILEIAGQRSTVSLDWSKLTDGKGTLAAQGLLGLPSPAPTERFRTWLETDIPWDGQTNRRLMSNVIDRLEAR